jgi:hypothetical protein
VIIAGPVFEVVEPGQIGSITDASPITVEFDQFEHHLGVVVLSGKVEHSGQGEGDFKKCPAVHSLEIDGRGLDMVIDFERIIFVGDPQEMFSKGDDAFSEWEGFPIFAVGTFDDSIELLLSHEDRAERQTIGFCI